MGSLTALLSLKSPVLSLCEKPESLEDSLPDFCSFNTFPCQIIMLKTPPNKLASPLSNKNIQCPKHEFPVSSQKNQSSISGVFKLLSIDIMIFAA